MTGPLKVDKVASPCNHKCQLSAANVCIGCGRDRSEIAAWTIIDDAAKRQIVDTARARLRQIESLKASSGFILVELFDTLHAVPKSYARVTDVQK